MVVKLKCRACNKKTNIKRYGYFCGIPLDYCEDHNYLFRDIKELNKIAKGQDNKQQIYLEKRRKAKEKTREKQWKKISII